MANGDVVNRTPGSISILLLDAATTGSTNNGLWVECPDGYGCGSVVASGQATTTVVSVNALNDAAQPAAATVGAVVTAGAAGVASYTSFAALPRWVKCAITATGTGTVTAILHARKLT